MRSVAFRESKIDPKERRIKVDPFKRMVNIKLDGYLVRVFLNCAGERRVCFLKNFTKLVGSSNPS